MEIGRTLYVHERAAWRAWLAEHRHDEPEIWLVYPRKHTGAPRLAYNDAVEEALCVGWIDSTLKALDPDRTAQRFTPRRPGSAFSQPNVERLRRLLERGLVAEDLVADAREIVAAPFAWPEDVMAALRADEAAWDHFQRFAPAYQRIRVAYVDAGRSRPGEHEKRLASLLEKTRRGVQFGFGIESYY